MNVKHYHCSICSKTCHNKRYCPQKGKKAVSVLLDPTLVQNVDILIEGGHYTKRADFFTQAIKILLEQEKETLRQILENKTHTSTLKSKKSVTKQLTEFEHKLIETLREKGVDEAISYLKRIQPNLPTSYKKNEIDSYFDNNFSFRPKQEKEGEIST